MPDPRNVAHDKTVQHNKKDEHKPVTPADAVTTAQPGKKPLMAHHAKDAKPASDATTK